MLTVPDALFRACERAAKRMSLDRNAFYARALDAYLERQGREITRRLNVVHAAAGTEPDPVILAYSLEMLRRVEWEE